MPDSLAIDLRHITKVYGRRVRALDGIDMQVRRGEVFGLLGPNGAGKSTLVKIIMSVTRPTRADGLVLGRPIGSKASLAKVGYLPEHHRFPRYLTGRQTLEFFAALSNADRPTRKARAAQLLETVGMTRWADAKVATYSKGMMQRIGVANALANDPDLVILDEPTDGVDPVGRREIRDVLLALKAQGKTVFVNSHLLSELEMMSDRVAILVAGRVVRQGTLDELTRDSQCFSIEVETTGDAAALLQATLQTHAQARWDVSAPPGVAPPRPRLAERRLRRRAARFDRPTARRHVAGDPSMRPPHRHYSNGRDSAAHRRPACRRLTHPPHSAHSAVS